MKLLMRLLREPLFHFIAIGGLIFALFAAIDDTGEAPGEFSGNIIKSIT